MLIMLDSPWQITGTLLFVPYLGARLTLAYWQLASASLLMVNGKFHECLFPALSLFWLLLEL